jgi:hypothetical protein
MTEATPVEALQFPFLPGSRGVVCPAPPRLASPRGSRGPAARNSEKAAVALPVSTIPSTCAQLAPRERWPTATPHAR